MPFAPMMNRGARLPENRRDLQPDSINATASPSRHCVDTRTVVFLLISAFYFADTMLRASLKTFWFDELYTVYLCRLPTFHATWAAVLHGADFNPPLLYLLTRAANHIFGEGLIATRLPAILGFWIFGVCLYLFASRRLGRTAGCVAALAPIFTLSHNYAYEARAHGIVLAWCGLMLVCWQRSREDSAQQSWKAPAWTVGFGLSFLCALLTHVYAVYLVVPFFVVEIVALFRRRRPSFSTFAAMLAAILIIAPLYLRMVRTFKAINSGGGMPLHNFILGIYGPSLLLLILAIALTSRRHAKGQSDPSQADKVFTTDESIVACGLLLLPVIGGIGVEISHGPFFDRYFLASTAGFALLFARSVMRRSGPLAGRVLAAMLVLVAGDICLGIHARLGGDLFQIEPASHFRFSANPSRPLDRDAALRMDRSNRDVLVIEEHNYLYLFFYAPDAIRRRLVFGAPDAENFALVSDRRLAKWAKVDLHTASYREFFATHSDFLVYSSNKGTFNGGCGDCIQPFLDAGYTLRSVEEDADGLLEHFSK